MDVLLTGLAGPGAIVDPSRVQVSVGGVSVPALTVSQVGSSSTYDVQFDLSAAVPAPPEMIAPA